MASRLSAALLHYKFLPGDIEKYRDYVNSGVHWNNSSQYRSYIDGVDTLGSVNFFDKDTSVRYRSSADLSEIKIDDLTVPPR